MRFPHGFDRDQKLALKFFTPDGYLYQELPVRVTTAEEPRGSRHSSRRPLIASAILPIGGTAIVTSSLYGIWSVEAYVDDAETACSAPKQFVIQP